MKIDFAHKKTAFFRRKTQGRHKAVIPLCFALASRQEPHEVPMTLLPYNGRYRRDLHVKLSGEPSFNPQLARGIRQIRQLSCTIRQLSDTDLFGYWFLLKRHYAYHTINFGICQANPAIILSEKYLVLCRVPKGQPSAVLLTDHLYAKRRFGIVLEAALTLGRGHVRYGVPDGFPRSWRSLV